MFSTLTAKLGLAAVIVAVCLVASCGILRNWNKIIHHKEPRPPRVRTEEFDVLSAESGGTLLCKPQGRDKRDKRPPVRVELASIYTPAQGEPLFAESRDNLTKLAGVHIRVEVRGRLHDVGSLDSPEPLEGRKEIVVGTVYGATGACLQLEQLRQGLGRVVGDVSAEWTAAQAEAKKQKRGLWQ